MHLPDIEQFSSQASTDSLQINISSGEMNFVEYVSESENGILRRLRMPAEDIGERYTGTKPIHNLDEVKYEVSITENYGKMECMFENIQYISQKVSPRPFVDPTTTTSGFGSSSLGKSAYKSHQTYVGDLMFKSLGSQRGTLCVALKSNTKEDRERQLRREEENPQKGREAHIQIQCENFEGKTTHTSAKVCVGKLGSSVFRTNEYRHHGRDRLGGSREMENQKGKKKLPFAKKDTITLQLATHFAKATIILDAFKYPTSCFTLYLEAEKNDANLRDQDDDQKATTGLLSRQNNEIAASRKGCVIG